MAASHRSRLKRKVPVSTHPSESTSIDNRSILGHVYLVPAYIANKQLSIALVQQRELRLSLGTNGAMDHS